MAFALRRTVSILWIRSLLISKKARKNVTNPDRILAAPSNHAISTRFTSHDVLHHEFNIAINHGSLRIDLGTREFGRRSGGILCSGYRLVHHPAATGFLSHEAFQTPYPKEYHELSRRTQFVRRIGPKHWAGG